MKKLVVATALGMLLNGCSGKVAADGVDANMSDTASSDSSALDTNGSDGDGADVLVSGTCKMLMDGVCSSAMKDCCSTKGITYDDAGCRKWVADWCELRVSAQAAGLVAFDPIFLDSCIAGWRTALTKCTIDRQEQHSLMAACRYLFRGLRGGGEPCKTTGIESVSCYGECDSTNLRCVSVSACGTKRGEIPYCPAGRRCRVTEVPSCEPGLAVGSPCKFDDCGTYHVCRDGVCAKGLLGGATCGVDADCASGVCASGSCTSIDAEVATPQTCGGK